MRALFHPYDISEESEMLEPLDFNRRSRLKHVDRIFKAEILNVIRLTDNPAEDDSPSWALVP